MDGIMRSRKHLDIALTVVLLCHVEQDRQQVIVRIMLENLMGERDMKPEPEWEYGLEADCWHCDRHFVKTQYCPECGYYVCPNCGKCGCHLSKDQRQVVDKTFAALEPILRKRKLIGNSE